MPIAGFTDHPLVHGLTPAEMADLAAGLEPVVLRAGDSLCRQGAPAAGLFLVSDGRLQVTQRLGEGTDDVTLCHLTAPTVVGEMELLTGRASVCSVLAEEAVTGWRLPAERFRDLLHEGNDAVAKLVRNIAQVLVSRLIESNSRYLSEVDPSAHHSIGAALTGLWERVSDH